MVLPKNLVFDLGGVLIDLNVNGMLEGFADVGLDARRFMADSTDSTATTVCEGMSMGKLLSDYQMGLFSTEELLHVVLPECSEGITAEQLIRAWNGCLCSIPPERLAMIRSLREEGYRTYMLSNTNDLHWQHIVAHDFAADGLGVDDVFDGVFLSHEMHLAKPDARIYKAVLREIGAEPRDCFFVDDARVNVEAARHEGIEAHWLNLEEEDIVHMMARIMEH